MLTDLGIAKSRLLKLIKTSVESGELASLRLARVLHRMARGRILRKSAKGTPFSKLSLDLLDSLEKAQHSAFSLTRIGGSYDGGYYIPVDLPRPDAVFSPGVGSTVEFDLHYANQGVRVFQADGTVDSSPVSHENFHFTRENLGPDSLVLIDWVRSAGFDDSSNLVLQMDIEGAEWEVLADVDERLISKFQLIILELHDLDYLLLPGFENRAQLLSKIFKSHEVVCAIPNNFVASTRLRGIEVPPVVEVTLVRKDLLTFLVREKEPRFLASLNHPRLATSRWKLGRS